MTAIAVLHKDEILKRVANGDKITDIGGRFPRKTQLIDALIESYKVP